MLPRSLTLHPFGKMAPYLETMALIALSLRIGAL